MVPQVPDPRQRGNQIRTPFFERDFINEWESFLDKGRSAREGNQQSETERVDEGQ